MILQEEQIGLNIREVRDKKGLSQDQLAIKCGISNSTLSLYENGRKIPGLTSISKIATALEVPIDRLYYGDSNRSFIDFETDDGMKIVNSIYLLWDKKIISYYENAGGLYFNSTQDEVNGFFLSINCCILPIKSFINQLNEFERTKKAYSDPDGYLKMIKESAAKQIDEELNDRKKGIGRAVSPKRKNTVKNSSEK